MFDIDFTPEAKVDLKSLRKFEQQEVIDGVQKQLVYEPTVETRNRKKLRPNEVADWEARIGTFRVFYNVDEEAGLVTIEAIGFKVGSQLFIRGEEKTL
jgi:mRNA-degrading endonuclease RelE of RelBE toxin-antitoxin system